jgi:hypothetical protein
MVLSLPGTKIDVVIRWAASWQAGDGSSLDAPPDVAESQSVSETLARLAARRQERREAEARRRRRRRRFGVLLAVVVLLSPAVYSYTATMLQPSSLPLGVRSVE